MTDNTDAVSPDAYNPTDPRYNEQLVQLRGERNHAQLQVTYLRHDLRETRARLEKSEAVAESWEQEAKSYAYKLDQSERERDEWKAQAEGVERQHTDLNVGHVADAVTVVECGVDCGCTIGQVVDDGHSDGCRDCDGGGE